MLSLAPLRPGRAGMPGPGSFIAPAAGVILCLRAVLFTVRPIRCFSILEPFMNGHRSYALEAAFPRDRSCSTKSFILNPGPGFEYRSARVTSTEHLGLSQIDTSMWQAKAVRQQYISLESPRRRRYARVPYATWRSTLRSPPPDTTKARGTSR